MKPNNKPWLLHGLISFLFCSLVLLSATVAAAESAPSGKAASAPPSVKIQYVVRVKYAALSIGGTSTVYWEHQDDAYSIQTRARANMLGVVLVTTSKGRIGPDGLKPELFTEKRLNRDETRTTFDRQKRTVTFSGSGKSLPISDLVQDRTSVVWQLVFMARTSPEKFVEGAKINLEVCGRSQIDKWSIDVLGQRSILAHLGSIETVYLYKEDERGRKTEAWLAPDMEWYPVRLIFTDDKDFRLEQNFQKFITD